MSSKLVSAGRENSQSDLVFGKMYSLSAWYAAFIYSPTLYWIVKMHAVISGCQPHCIKPILPLYVYLVLFLLVVLNCHCQVSALVGHFPFSTMVVAQQEVPAEREKTATGPLLLHCLSPPALSWLLEKTVPRVCAIRRGHLHCHCGPLPVVVPEMRSTGERNQQMIFCLEFFLLPSTGVRHGW